MLNGLVLLKLVAGKETRALQKIARIKGVKSVIGAFGSWDAVAHTEAGSLDSLAALVVSKIRSTDGVSSTETLIEVII